jgi:hypothetical protein
VTENDDTRMNDRPGGGTSGAAGGTSGAAGGPSGGGFDDDRLLAFALGLADDPELVSAADGDPELGRRLEAMHTDVRAVGDGVNAAVPAPDDSYTDLSQERWRGLAPYLQDRRPARQPRQPRAFFHRALAPAAALLVVAAILGGVFALENRGKSSSSTSTLAAKGNSLRAPEAAPGAATGALHMASPVSQGPLAADYDTVVVARAGQVSDKQQRFTVLRTLKGSAPQTLRLHSEGGTLPRDSLAILYLRPAISEAGPGETLGLFGGLQARNGAVSSEPNPTPRSAANALTQRIPTPQPADGGYFGPTVSRAAAHGLPHIEVLVEPLPRGTKADAIQLP